MYNLSFYYYWQVHLWGGKKMEVMQSNEEINPSANVCNTQDLQKEGSSPWSWERILVEMPRVISPTCAEKQSPMTEVLCFSSNAQHIHYQWWVARAFKLVSCSVSTCAPPSQTILSSGTRMVFETTNLAILAHFSLKNVIMVASRRGEKLWPVG